ncbi:MAG: YHS domain-containing protein [bacterium]
MKRIFVVSTLLVFACTLFGLSVKAQMEHEHGQHEPGSMKKTESDQAVCPVTNKVMKRSEAPASYTLYFASEAAKEAFLKNPAKFLTATCLVMGGQVSKLTAPYSEYNGVVYYFCCDEDKGKFEKEPKKYIGKSPMKLETRGHSEMKMEGTMLSDPVCGMKISTQEAKTTEYKGKTYHFCSDECKEKFTKTPEKYMKE